MSFQETVGRRLRSVRLQKGMSLKDVEQRSKGRFKASVLGAYERGERSLSVPRLHELSAFFRVPVEFLLAEEGRKADVAPRLGQVQIDLKSLDKLPVRERGPINQYLELIRSQRGDFTDEVMSIRREDLRPIACLYNSTPQGISSKLEELGILVVH